MADMNWIKGSTLTFLPVASGIAFASYSGNGWAGLGAGVLVFVLSLASWALGAALSVSAP